MSIRKEKQRPGWLEKRTPDHLISHQEEVRLTVYSDGVGQRLDLFLKEGLPWRSRASVRRLLDRCDVRVSGRRRKASYRLKKGEEVVVPCPPPREDPAEMADIELNIVYEDDALIVLDKQPNIVVHPVGRHRYHTLINALHLKYRRPGDPDNDIQPKLGHRLDRETSGVLVVCKTNEARRSVSWQFETGAVVKRYLALAEGSVEADAGLIDEPIGPAVGSDHGMKRAVRPDGDAARTGFEVVERLPGMTLLRLRLLTGRSHQIRVHLQHIGNPILCDKFYGVRRSLRLSEVRPPQPGEEDRVLLDRQALHSSALTIRHPSTGKPISFEAPLPGDMEQTVREARATGESPGRHSKSSS